MDNFAWIGTWTITSRCNLNCVYCPPRWRLKARDFEDVNYNAAVEKMSRIRPKLLNVSGGEPTLVKDLPRILEKIKRLWNPFIRVVSNGTNPLFFTECAPYLDRIFFSLDGYGELNKKTKGIDGNKVLRGIQNLLYELRHIDSEVEVGINHVVTTDTALFLEQTVKNIRNVSDDIVLVLSPIIPPDHEKSIIVNKLIRDKFWQLYQKVRSNDKKVFHHFHHFHSTRPLRVVNCYNQFFRVMFDTHGNPRTCAHNLYTYTKDLARLLGKKRDVSFLPKMAKTACNRILGRYDFKCYHPCNCDAWLDSFLQGVDTDNTRYFVKNLYGRFTNEEVQEAYEFISNHINKNFKGSLLNGLLN